MTTARGILLRLHLWAALASGTVVAFMALTGALLLFERPIEHALHPELTRVAPAIGRASLDALAAEVARRYPGEAAGSVRFTDSAGEPIEFNTRRGRRVYAHPATGEILGARVKADTFFGRVLELHRRLALGATGQRIVEASAMIFVVSLLSGLWLWLPRHGRAWRTALTLRRGLHGRARLFNLHNVAGVYAALALLASALTGLAWSLSAIALVRHRPGPAAEQPARAEPGRLLAFDAAREIALRHFPGATSVLIDLPREPGAPLGVFVVERGAPHFLARSRLFLHPHTGAVIALERYAGQGIALKLLAISYPIHTGRLGGWPMQVLMFATALAVPVLSVTGASLWWRRRCAKTEAPAMRLAA